MKLWTEKYRPQTLGEYVTDAETRAILETWIKEGIPNILLEGMHGVGKTSLAYILMNELQVPASDVLFVNASRERKPDELQERIINHLSIWGAGEYRYVILDECDALTPLMQKTLRGILEQYESCGRFIMTCNYQNKIIPPLLSRLQTLHFRELDREAYVLRVAEILLKEGVQFKDEDLIFYLDACYPDLRKAINECQKNTRNQWLHRAAVDADRDWYFEIVELFQNKAIIAGREELVGKIAAEEYPEFYQFLYDNLHIISADKDKQAEAIVILASGLCDLAISAVPEINLSATLIKLNALQE